MTNHPTRTEGGAERRDRVRKEMNRCKHFTGVSDGTCKAGVSYVELHGGQRRWGGLVCLNGTEEWTCDRREFPDEVEARETIARVDAAIAEVVRKLNASECTECGATYKGKQVGRCVYCEHCNARQYQGTVRP